MSADSSSDLKGLELARRLAAVDCPAFAHRRNNRAGASPDGPPPIVLARGRGHEVTDVDGRTYVDLVAGFGSLLLGHDHPAIRQAIAKQSTKLVQGMGDVYASDVKVEIMERIAALSAAAFDWPDAQVLLCQSGGDAVTAALKTATLATGRDTIIAFDGAYHGLGYAPLAACGFQAGFRAPFAEQLSKHILFAPYPGVRGATERHALDFVAQCLEQEKVAAVLVEPILGRGGCVVPQKNFLRQLAAQARASGALLIADEIWTGLGRTGTLVRSADEGAHADIVCFGKGLGGGLSLSACVAPAAIMGAWAQGGQVVHSSTHAGHPLSCATALATLETLEREQLVRRSREVGSRFVATLQRELTGLEAVTEIRGEGLLIGIELSSATLTQRLVGELREAGFLVITGGVAGDTLTLSPALTIEEADLSRYATTLSSLLHSTAAETD
ncbi:MAG: aspartate aminotransferase family protein [Polyangiaceae bacterium]